MVVELAGEGWCSLADRREGGTRSSDLNDRISMTRGVREGGRSGPRAVAIELAGDGWCSPAGQRKGGRSWISPARYHAGARRKRVDGGWGVGPIGIGSRERIWVPTPISGLE